MILGFRSDNGLGLVPEGRQVFPSCRPGVRIQAEPIGKMIDAFGP